MEERRRRTFPRTQQTTVQPAAGSKASNLPRARTSSPPQDDHSTTANVFFYSQRGGSKPMLHQRPTRRASMPPALTHSSSVEARTVMPGLTRTAFQSTPYVARRQAAAHASLPLSSSSSPVHHVHTHSVEPDDALKARLLDVKHLFLCCRDLLSIRHIQYLASMPNLEQLNLHMNLIRHVDGLTTLHHLVELDLSANEIRTLDLGAFDGLHALRRLNLSSNFLTSIPHGVLRPLGSLAWLSLGFNELVDVAGLCDIPAAAPLTSVDVCGNQIATLSELTRALATHAETIQELRLEVPKTTTLLHAEGSAGAADDPLLAVIASVQRPPHLFTRENPCCLHSLFPGKPEANSEKPKGKHGSDAAALVLEETPDGAHYVEGLMRFFPHLVVLNGVSFGLDPLLPRVMVTASTTSPLHAHRQWETDGAEAGEITRHSPEVISPSYPLRWTEKPPVVHQSGVARALGFDKPVRSRSASSSSSSSENWSSSRTSSSSSSSSSPSRHRRARTTRKARRHHSKATSTQRAAGGKRLPSQDSAAIVDMSDSIHSVTPERAETSPAAKAPSSTATTTTGESTTVVVAEVAPPSPRFSPSRDYTTHAVTAAVGAAATAVGAPESAYDGESTCTSRRASQSGSTCAETLQPLKKDTSPLATLKWRPKRVSRGTNTEVSLIATRLSATADDSPAVATTAEGTRTADAQTEASTEHLASADAPAAAPAGATTPVRILERELAHRCEELEQGEVRLQRLREQLSLRVAVEVDLRRQLSLVHQRCQEVEQAKDAQAVRLRAQVLALKDELNRRAQEAQLMARQHRVALQAADARDESRAALEATLAQQAARLKDAESRLEADHDQAQKALQRLEAERSEWENNAALWQAQCESAEQQQSDVYREIERAHAEDLQRAFAAGQEACADKAALEASECAQRYALEHSALASLSEFAVSFVHGAWQNECRRVASTQRAEMDALAVENHTLAAHVEMIQREYKDVLDHAEQEMSQLRDALAAKTSMSDQKDCGSEVGTAQPIITTAVDAPPTSTTTTPAITTMQVASDNSLSAGGIHDTTSYWRETCRFREAEIKRLEAALRISHDSSHTLSQENSRLLHQLQEELPQRREAESAAWEREKENLLRTVHNLQEDLSKKAQNVLALEAEARAKIDSKRQRIAELEEDVEALKERQALATQQNVELRDALDRAEQQRRDLEKNQSAQRDAEAEEKAALIHALRMARDQLVTVHESHSAVVREHEALRDHCARQQTELDESRRAYRTLQDEARAKQKAAFEAFSRVMMSAGDGVP